MGDSRYKRVSRAHPCLICGKPDWCSRAGDDSISFCARVTAGADRLSRKERWGVFYHDRTLIDKPFRNTSEPPHGVSRSKSQAVLPAPLEIRDFVYTALLRLSPAKDHDCLINGAKGLKERALDNFDDYGAIPCSVQKRKDLAAQIRLLLNQNFPAYLRENPHGIRHVPGFWIDERGEVNLWKTHDYSHPLLLVPYRNPAGRIQACQIRFTGALRANKKRYLWLSLPGKNSAGSGTPIHYAGWRIFGQSEFRYKSVLVTEGALKADVVNRLRSEFFAIANGGIACAHEIIVNVSRGKTLYLAFDNDYHENPSVVRQLARILKLRLKGGGRNGLSTETKILSWSRSAKGIDDALLQGEKFEEMTVADWFSVLNDESQREVKNVWETEN
jgi:hypothetical protein